MFRTKVLKIARARGYKGDDKDTDALLKFLDENGIDIASAETGEAMDAKALRSALTKKSVVTIEDDESETDDSEASKKAIEDAKKEAEKQKARADRAEALAKGGSKWTAGEATREEEGGSGNGPTWAPGQQASYMRRKQYDRRANDGKESFSCADEAEGFAAFFRKAAAGSKGYAKSREDGEILKSIMGQKTQVEYNDAYGGALVPDDFLPSLIKLREKVGGAHMLARQIDMSRDTLMIPRRTGGLTAYTPGEGNPLTKSTATYDNVMLVASLRGVLAKYSAELFNDAALNVSGELADEAVYVLEYDLENAYLNGDGTSTYWGQVGLAGRFQQILEDAGGTWPTNAANLAGLVVGAGAGWSNLTQQNFDDVVARRADLDIPMSDNWVASRNFWASTMVPKIRAAGGAVYEIFQSQPGPQFNGAPVTTTPRMPKSSAASTISAYFGDFKAASAVGRVRGSMAIATSEHVDFASSLINIRVTHRACVSVHDLGNYNASAASWTYSPVVGLITTA